MSSLAGKHGLVVGVANKRSISWAIAQAALRQTETHASVSAREDATFQIVMGAFITAAGTDIATTMYHVGKGTAREAGFGGWCLD